MRVAFFSPMPPARSGIADYSAALARPLAGLVELEVFADAPPAFDPAQFDLAVYQIGNNGYHAFAYQAALRHPGVVVMHESNLHHLIADLTIKRGDWDAYLRECEYNGGTEALAFAGRVRRLEVGPDYEGLPMTRRILERARGVIVHSRYMHGQMRAAGFQGPVAVIPHGAWIPQVDRLEYRARLGVDETTPLVGTFGFLKPYKRLPESLRAFARLVKLQPRAKMILAGEPHPDFPIQPLIRSLGLDAHVRLPGFTPIEDFAGYIAACDIVLNLRFPTVGESSGSLLRALGMGRAVLVSEVGSFAEFPDDVCLKVPVGAGEEDVIFEYLNLLVSRPEIARAFGDRARCYVERECSWEAVAARYAEFLECVAAGREWNEGTGAGSHGAGEREQGTGAVNQRAWIPGDCAITTPVPCPPSPVPSLLAEYLQSWATTGDSRSYLNTHLSRLVRTLELTPCGSASDRVLEMGAYLQITPALRSQLGYGEVRGSYYGPAGQVDHKRVVSSAGEVFECDVDLFDAEKDPFPYPDAYFRTVLCCELIEHLFEDPMHLLAEVNRILLPGGTLVLTTPNITSLRALAAILQGFHPGFFPSYIRPAAPGAEVDARHNREYAPREIRLLLGNAGFEVTRLETGEFRDLPHPEHRWVVHLLERYSLPADERGDGIYAVARKTGPVQERYPGWLYT